MTTGVLVVSADEGRIDEVRFEGPPIPAVAAALAPLVGAGPVKLSEVERRLLLATDSHGVRIEGTRFLREGGRGILLVRAARDNSGGGANSPGSSTARGGCGGLLSPRAGVW